MLTTASCIQWGLKKYSEKHGILDRLCVTALRLTHLVLEGKGRLTMWLHPNFYLSLQADTGQRGTGEQV